MIWKVGRISDDRWLSLMGGAMYSDRIKTLNNGWRVLAHEIDGQLEAYKFANVTQAKKRAAMYPGCWVTIGRPFYVRVPENIVDGPARAH